MLTVVTWNADNVPNELVTLHEKQIISSVWWLLLVAFDRVL